MSSSKIRYDVKVGDRYKNTSTNNSYTVTGVPDWNFHNWVYATRDDDPAERRVIHLDNTCIVKIDNYSDVQIGDVYKGKEGTFHSSEYCTLLSLPDHRGVVQVEYDSDWGSIDNDYVSLKDLTFHSRPDNIESPVDFDDEVKIGDIYDVVGGINDYYVVTSTPDYRNICHAHHYLGDGKIENSILYLDDNDVVKRIERPNFPKPRLCGTELPDAIAITQDGSVRRQVIGQNSDFYDPSVVHCMINEVQWYWMDGTPVTKDEFEQSMEE